MHITFPVTFFRLVLLAFLGIPIFTFAAFGQKSEVPESVLGDWYGESKCTVPNSPCHDEVVVYHLSRVKGAPGRVHWSADKIVNGKPENMGELDMEYDAAKHEMSVTFKAPRTGGDNVWWLKIDGDKMRGTLMSEGQLYRKVAASRKKS